MKSRIILAALAAISMSGTAQAESAGTAAKQSAVFVGTAVAGAVLGGPIGYLAGGLTGAWLATKVGDASELEPTAAQLADAQASLDSMSAQLRAADTTNRALEDDLGSARHSVTRYRDLAARNVTFELMFHTGESGLTADGDARVERLAAFLAEQPDVAVTLSGFADPRGDDAFNLDLSERRARTVAAALEANGVAAPRISLHAFGDQQSAASAGDLDAYALERRVVIELSVPGLVTEGVTEAVTEAAAEVASVAD